MRMNTFNLQLFPSLLVFPQEGNELRLGKHMVMLILNTSLDLKKSDFPSKDLTKGKRRKFLACNNDKSEMEFSTRCR